MEGQPYFLSVNMIIEEPDFRLTQISEGSCFWDLELLYTIKPKGKESRQEFKVCGYGLTMNSAIKRIANFRISQKHTEDSLTMKQYLKEYNEIIKELSNIIS